MNQNEDLKRARGNIPYSAIASKLRVSESTLYRWFRSKLSIERKKEILNAIKEIMEVE
ncbi:helix-turn-helix domain-containing protein [Bacillus atrophaeus]|uniref:helix-turn-helix domain-containing protein n=1 Tax=Bacillus atrophaeus TaxID=1452 RepID=UPI00039E7CFE|nr:helix-turn-helix domain-containing protein [Bacillus atrophaeus]